ncbi:MULTISPECIES: hypothetical protein [unclassified Bordetella]|uniref:hypothetical protein n=1 Tax=unclassified Bordetella TaxID=2630031 RepID=UPI00132B92EC|nr:MULTISPECIES: hypothetical protein [unclassified Bordetella]MVW70852.1 hypothetical protein [Bordetella sp. 15P40C-2]MVW79551.1 hypothetical protein [Bordetella sp. 02P26C-1]
MSKSPAIERAVRIELLRARAALERESLAYDIAATTRSLSPGNLVKRWIPSVGRSNVTGLLWQGVSLARRYPVISSTVSAFLMKRGKKLGLLKLAGGAFLGWQAFRAWRHASDAASRDV